MPPDRHGISSRIFLPPESNGKEISDKLKPRDILTEELDWPVQKCQFHGAQGKLEQLHRTGGVREDRKLNTTHDLGLDAALEKNCFALKESLGITGAVRLGCPVRLVLCHCQES